MAKISFGPLVSDISGSIGGIVFRQNNGGPTIQAKSPSRPTMSEDQRIAVSYAQAASKAWTTRTERDMRSWENWALQHPQRNRIGTRRPPNIYATYMRRAILQMWCQGSVSSTRITTEPSDDLTLYRMVCNDATADVELRCYGAAAYWLSACWFRLIPTTVGKHPKTPFKILWRFGLRMPLSASPGTDEYGAYRGLNAPDASEYLYSLVQAPCYAEFRVISNVSADCYAQRTLGPVAVAPPA